MPTCGECEHYPWRAHTRYVYTRKGEPGLPRVPCRIQPMMLVWHDIEKPVDCYNFKPNKKADTTDMRRRYGGLRGR